MRRVVLAVLAACASPPASRPVGDVPPELPHDQVRRYTIWLGGARVGTATETEAWTAAGVHLRRVEDMRFLRGEARVELATAIDIDADPALVARSVRWRELGAGDHEAQATRGPDGWHVSTGATLPAAAVPAELVPLLVRRDGAFTGTLFMPARGFVSGAARVEPVAPGRLVARLQLAGGALAEATIDLGRDGVPARVVDGEGVIELRATAAQALAHFPPVDLIAATAVPIAGEPPSPGAARRLELDGHLALPALPGQRARAVPGGAVVELDRALPGALPAGPAGPDRAGEVAALVAAVRARVTPDLAAAHAGARDAADATAGDCTTFALAYAALATRRGLPTRVVTGLRVDGNRLVRHRWAVTWTGRAWVAVDAAFGAAPAGGNLVGLAVDDADDAGLVAGEAALAEVHAAAWQP